MEIVVYTTVIRKADSLYTFGVIFTSDRYDAEHIPRGVLGLLARLYILSVIEMSKRPNQKDSCATSTKTFLAQIDPEHRKVIE